MTKQKRVVTREQLKTGFRFKWDDCPAHPGGEEVQYYYCNPVEIGPNRYEVEEPVFGQVSRLLTGASREFIDVKPQL
jgi:hypothetical protein